MSTKPCLKQCRCCSADISSEKINGIFCSDTCRKRDKHSGTQEDPNIIESIMKRKVKRNEAQKIWRSKLSNEKKEEFRLINKISHQQKRSRVSLDKQERIELKKSNTNNSKIDNMPLGMKLFFPKVCETSSEETKRFVTPEKNIEHHLVTENLSIMGSPDAMSQTTIIPSKNATSHKRSRAHLPLKVKQEIQSKDTQAHRLRRAMLPQKVKQEIQSNNMEHRQEKRAMLPQKVKQEIQSNDREHRQEKRAMLPQHVKQEIQSKDTQAHQQKRNNEPDQLDGLCNDIIWKIDVDADIIDCLRNHYTKHPNLALFYYYCCSTNPGSHIRNDEFSSEHSTNRVWNRISNIIGPPIGQQEAIRCETKAEQIACSNNQISFCASCCERIVLGQGKNVIIETPINKLHKSFLLTEEQAKSMHLMEKKILDSHVMVLQHNGQLYHLNPDLVVDKEKIALCQICEKDPLDHDFSIANGHDYGRRGSLPSLNTTTQNAIIPFRCFNINIKLMANHSTGHSIVFPCDGPLETAKVLPCSHTDCRPQITFLGPKESWRKTKHLYKYLYELDVEGAYQWMKN